MDNRHKLKEERLSLQHIFPMRTVRQRHRLPRGAVQSPSLNDFKTGLDDALSSPV